MLRFESCSRDTVAIDTIECKDAPDQFEIFRQKLSRIRSEPSCTRLDCEDFTGRSALQRHGNRVSKYVPASGIPYLKHIRHVPVFI